MSSSTLRGAPVASCVEVGDRNVTVLRAGHGPVRLYLHGVCDVHSVGEVSGWTGFLERLASSGDVIAPALAGFAGSTGVEELEDTDDYAWHLVDLLDALGLATVDVVGHCLGGWLAAELALRHPGRVDRLVLVGPLGMHVPGVIVPLFFDAVAPWGTGTFASARRLLFADPDGQAAVGALPDGMGEHEQLRWFAGLAGAARLGWEAPHFQSRALARRLGRIAAPTLVVRGEQDLLVPEETGRAWVDGLQDARFLEVPDVGHCVPLEWPDAAGEVDEFLRAGSTTRPPRGEPKEL